MSSGLGIVSLLPLQLMMLLSGGGLMGTPPGERDAAYLNCAPQSSLVYYEWAPSVPGKADAPGVDGFIADPEIQVFTKKLNTLMTQLMFEVIKKSPENAKVTLKDLPELSSLLIGKSGCLYLNYLFSDNSDENSNPLAAMVGVNGTIILNAERNANRVEEILTNLISLIPNVKERPAKLDHFLIPSNGNPFHVTIHRHESYFIIGWGKPTVQRAIDGLTGKLKGLGDSEKFHKAISSLKMERTSAVSWIDVHGALETVTKILGPQGAMVNGIATMAGVTGVDSIASVCGVMENQIRNRVLLVTDGKTEGVLSLASGKGMLVSDLMHIPYDADLVFTLSINMSKMMDTFKMLMGAVSQRELEEIEKGISEMENALKLSLKDDFFAAFGDVWTFYNSPSLGGVFMTSPMGTLKVKDYEKAKNVFDSLVGLLKKELTKTNGSRRKPVLRETEFIGLKIYILEVPDKDFPFAPSFCLAENQLFLALNPQTIKGQIRLAQKKNRSFVQRLSKEIPVPKGDVISFSYLNTAKLMEIAYAVAPYLARYVAMELQKEGIDVTINDLPSAQAIMPYLANSWSAVARVKNGLLFESQSPLPFAGGASLLYNLPMILMKGGARKRSEKVKFDNISEQLNQPPPKEKPIFKETIPQ